MLPGAPRRPTWRRARAARTSVIPAAALRAQPPHDLHLSRARRCRAAQRRRVESSSAAHAWRRPTSYRQFHRPCRRPRRFRATARVPPPAHSPRQSAVRVGRGALRSRAAG
eukprot:6987278-Prymnesium_polylepis.1